MKLKYRVWEPDTNFMNNQVRITWNRFGSDEICVEATEAFGWIEVDSKYLMQSTGLKDKHGVEIFEGDIVKMFANINKHTDSFADKIEAVFRNSNIVRDGACFKTTFNGNPSYVLNENAGSMVKNMEVIGNIYENPELLEERK